VREAAKRYVDGFFEIATSRRRDREIVDACRSPR
jgi:hypothetical protein